jgi:prepilin-type N-terminal cleavage/methylation domain-containing protein
MKKFFTSFQSHSTSRGFSLIELLVAISIFAVISATLVFNYNTYAGREELGNATHQLALDIREAQAFAMGVRATAGGQYPSYGIRFATGNPYEYLIYADLNQNDVYDLGGICGEPNSECVKVTEMPRKIKIKSLCGITSPTTSSVDCPGPLSRSQYFDVLFTRPNPDAGITGSPSGAPLSYQTAEITLVTVKGYTKKVTIASIGQIVVK